MVKQRNSRGILLASNLPQLQNLIKVRLSSPFCSHSTPLTIGLQRDPKGYREEFLTQHNHYLSLLRLNTLAPSSSSGNTEKTDDLFADLVTIICQVAQCYPDETKELPHQLRGLLLGTEGGGGTAKGELRRVVVKNLVMLRNKEVIDSIE